MAWVYAGGEVAATNGQIDVWGINRIDSEARAAKSLSRMAPIQEHPVPLKKTWFGMLLCSFGSQCLLAFY
ncbi:hypothetical protein CBW46_017435 [Paenibacillus xerothermodurans]|uniref:Uncharacterized protein n=1 Tax=Paenibacillus xerothermodurans TaxID=1977292 RepID=A0A2W1N988_PAEXE|nr:hypothetical protein CBW46_017435 [Paenibacillus xerothermodurans]